jgi:chromosomal replication initiator protein
MLTTHQIQQFHQKLKTALLEVGLPLQTATYITEQVTPLRIEGFTIVSTCRDKFYYDQIVSAKISLLQAIAKECWGEEYILTLVDSNEDSPSSFDTGGKTALPPLSPSHRSLNPQLTFETFVRGQSNVVAHSACESAAQNPGAVSNPLFIYGATGLGKTHLLHAVGNKILTQTPHAHIIYTTSIDFINEVIQGIRFGKMDDVRSKYYNCDVLLVDDIQFLENKDTCQVEFFHMFNELYQQGKQIVITSDKFPKNIPNIEERLKSRFMQGLLVDIEPPGFEDRVAILDAKAKTLGLKITQDILFLIATHIKTNVREMEGVLKTMLMTQHMTGHYPSIESTTALLKRITRFEPPALDATTIQKVVSNHFQISLLDLMGQNRSKKFVMARHIAIFLIRDLLALPVSEIAECFGKKDHTTIIHAINKIKETTHADLELKEHCKDIRIKLEHLAHIP